MMKLSFLSLFILYAFYSQGIFAYEFQTIEKTDIPLIQDYSFWIASLFNINQKQCQEACDLKQECMIFSFKNQNTCHLFTEMAFLIRNSNSSERIYKKITSKSYLNGLIHYWPIYQSNPKELVRYHEFTRFYRIKYTKNRFDQANSAFNFDNGAIFLPDGTYFQGGFTISLWFKLNSNKLNQQLIEIGNGMASDNFQLALSFNRRFSFCAYLHAVYGGQNLLLGTDPIEVNKWYHIGVTSDGKRANIYLNGQLKTSDRSIPMRNVQRTYNFLGFNYLKEVFFEGDLDDLKIFDRALSEEEMKEMYYMPF